MLYASLLCSRFNHVLRDSGGGGIGPNPMWAGPMVRTLSGD